MSQKTLLKIWLSCLERRTQKGCRIAAGDHNAASQNQRLSAEQLTTYSEFNGLSADHNAQKRYTCGQSRLYIKKKVHEDWSQ